MTTALATRLQKGLATLWTQLDVEKDCLPSKSCRWLLEELRELRAISVPAGYASSSRPLVEAIDMLQPSSSSPTFTLSLASTTSIAALLTSAVALLAAPLPPSTIYDPSRPTLPSEIISLILHQLAAAERTSDVAACCLISKGFLPLAREALYHTLYLTISEQKCDDRYMPLDLDTNARRGSDVAVNYGRLNTTLAGHSHLGALVRRVAVYSTIDDDDLDYVGALDILLLVLQSCRPQHFEYQGQPWLSEAMYVVRTLWRSRHQYQSLDLSLPEGSEEQGGTAALWEMLQEQKALERLLLRVERPANVPMGFSFSLKQLNLDVTYLDEHFAPLFETLLLLSTETLTHLSLGFDISSDDYSTPRLSHLCNLQSVNFCITRTDQSRDPVSGAVAYQCRALLKSLPASVTSLSLSGAESVYRPESNILDHLPSSLVSLDLHQVYFSAPTLLQLLRSRRLPHLRRLRLWDYMGIRGYEDWNAETRAEVQAVLEEMGIQSK
ncbi:hypothetical protein BCR35DRAFT_325556 [Leucosporidium creatinivorum]|uniref:Uncharacterized protein n=1 Tax=Leucosporidium creatinivorum TaxID=106004 RepID=A0A1Y2EZY2_9BASI|nr:hypothetical protein BCR35DRAFT_325556 [Leucosporidium creatinivorum]